MAFSIRNIFQKGTQPEAAPGGGNGEFPMFGIGGPNAATATAPSPFGMPSEGAANNGFGASIFKARDQGEDMQGQPVNARQGGAPFSPFGAQEGVSLTVGDLLPQLPPELVRGGGASPDQPVTISPQALEAALASGSLSVPVFEVYRVCPVLFQVPVSPQDPRMVPLPHNKLVALMSGRGGAGGAQQLQPFQQQQPAASPFGALPAGSPFAFTPPAAEMAGPSSTGSLRPAGALPPRRPAGVPPALPSQVDFAPVPALQLPGQEAAQPPAGGSPFGFPQAASPFASQVSGPPPLPGQSPFGAAMPGPFGMANDAALPAAAPSHQGLNSFTSLLSSASSPVTDPELSGGPFAAPTASPFGTPAQAPMAGQAESASAFGMPATASPFAMQSQNGTPSPFAAAGALFGTPGGASPFAAQGSGAGSPFAAQPQAGSPFAAPAGESPFASQPQNGGSPFAAQPQGGSPFAAQPQNGGSPFAAQPQGGAPFAAPAGESPFASQPPNGGSPFAAQPQGGSPFAAQPQSGASPFSAQPAGGESPFVPPAGGASPFAMPASSGQQTFSPSSAGGSPFAMPGGASPFSMPAASQEPAPGASPFASGVASFEPTPRPTTPESPKLGAVPFSSPPVQPGASATPFGLPTLSSAASHSMAASSKPADDNVDISLAAVLKGQTPQDLGFDPNFIPAWINTKLPASLVRQQLPSGQVIIDLGTIIDGTENTFRTVIAHGKREFNVRVPANEIFHLLPSVSSGSGPLAAEPSPPSFVAAQPAPVEASFLPVMPEAPLQAPAQVPASSPAPSGIIQPLGFQLPFAPAPRPAEAAAPAPEAFAPPAQQPKVQPIASFDPFAANAGDWGGKVQTAYFEPNRPGEIEGGLGSEQLFAPAAPVAPPVRPSSPSPFPAAAPAPEWPVPQPAPQKDNDPFAGLGDNPFLPASPAAPRALPEPVAQAAAPVFSPPPAPQPVFAPAPEAPRPATSPLVIPASKGPSVTLGAATGDPEQMLLRALLGASDRLDPDRVVQLTTQLPGVLAAVAVMGQTSIAYGSGGKPAQDFQSHAGETARSMRSLASLIGFDGAETLSITSGERLITFTFADALAFGVLHADREAVSGLRDKITLIGRELASLISRSGA